MISLTVQELTDRQTDKHTQAAQVVKINFLKQHFVHTLLYNGWRDASPSGFATCKIYYRLVIIEVMTKFQKVGD